MKHKKRLSLLAILFAIITTGGMFAYWASNVLGTQADTLEKINIGVGETINTTLTLTPDVVGGDLVPAGYATQNSVEEVVFTYTVQLTSNQNAGKGTEATLLVEYDNSAHHLVNVAINQPSQTIYVGGPDVLVVVTITLTEPANQTEYLEVAGKTFDIELSFTATI